MINKDKIVDLSNYINILLKAKHVFRVDLVLQDLENWNNDDIFIYSNELDKIILLLIDMMKAGEKPQLNVLTDILNLTNMNNCQCGRNNFTIAPNGKIYVCPGLYFFDESSYIGDVDTGINYKYLELFEHDKAPLCLECDVYHCKMCRYLNKMLTGEYNVSPKIQCVISHIERNKSSKLLSLLKNEGVKSIFVNEFYHKEVLDPLETIVSRIKNSKRKGEIL